MVRALYALIVLFAVIGLDAVPDAAASPPDPFATGDRAGEGSSTGSAAPAAAPAASPAAAAASPAPACAYMTEATCGRQNKGLLLKSAAYVFIVVLLFSLLRVWWNRRGTNTAGVRFIATLLPASGAAALLAYFDPARASAALLGFVPAAIAFVLVAIVLRIVRG